MLIDCRTHSDLNWKIEDKPKAFELQLGLNDPFFPIEDEMHLNAISLGLKYFSDKVWPQFPNAQIILYRGSADFSPFFKWTETQEKNFSEWKKSKASALEEHMIRLFCLEAFTSYFQLLAHKLPLEAPVHLIFDEPLDLKTAQIHHLLNPVRFEHFSVKTFYDFESNIGICFPDDDKCSHSVLEALDEYIKSQKSYRAIYEPFIIEQCDGLDEIHILPNTIGERGERMLQGFEAAGGKIIEIA